MSSDAVYARVEEALTQLSLRAEELRQKANSMPASIDTIEMRCEALGILHAIRVINKTVFRGPDPDDTPEPRDAQRMGE